MTNSVVKDYLKNYISDLNACLGCGVCRAKTDDVCPMWLASGGFEAQTPRGIVTMAIGILNGDISDFKSISELIYLCTMCKSCVERCGAINKEGTSRIRITDIVNALRFLVVDLGFVPSRVREFFENVINYGNPYGFPRDARDRLVEELGLEYFDPKVHEYLLWVGCNAVYNDVVKESLKSFIELLRSAGIKFGVLGGEEDCCGHEVLRLGERGLFEELARKNIETLRRRGVRKIITMCPHGYNAFKNDYPRVDPWIRNVEIYHHAQFLKMLIDSGRLRVERVNAKVTYHDPCFLGRYNNVYDEPRDVIKAVADLVEMPRNRKSSFCCGGGSGGFYTDYLGGSPNEPARIRIREALSTGANYLITACPICKIMLTSGAESEGVKDKIRIIDITQLINNK
jgi:Fe-S oxidoreductase